MASMARSRPDPSAPALALATQVPSVVVVDAEQFNMLVQQIRGLMEVVQVMHRQASMLI